MLETSILNTIKPMLDVPVEDESFDLAITAHINGAIMVCKLLTDSVASTFRITGPAEKWSDMLGEDEVKLDAIKDYIFMRVKMIFDPPGNSFKVESMQNQMKEYAYLLAIQSEEE